VRLGTISYLFTKGKNRKERTVPLTTQTVKVLTPWLTERAGEPEDPLFPSNRDGPLSRDAVEWMINKHTTTAADRCPSLHTKRVTAHVLRHYVDGWVMWPAAMFPVAGVSLRPVAAT
jgi:integrase/recombinase XerD